MALGQVVFWAVLTILLVIAEIVTVQLVAVWFAAGSLAAFVSSLFGIDFSLQIVIFIAGSVILLAATRPAVKKILKGKKIRTNADSVIGKECVVREEIDNISGTGRVFVDGLTWAARRADGEETISAGQKCRVVEIQGVKLMVEPVGGESSL